MLAAGSHTLTFKSENDDDSSKHCFLVKLTDSSAKVIEDYLRNQVSEAETFCKPRDGNLTSAAIYRRSFHANLRSSSKRTRE